MNSRRSLLVSLTLGLLFTAPARAHFLFVRIGPPAEGGRMAEVFFSEQAEAGDPTFIDKIAHTQLWLQTTPGKWEPLKVLKGADRLRARVPASGSLMVAGICQYGVIARPKKTPFLLCHYPKAAAGSPGEVNALKPLGKAPLEIVANLEDGRVRFLALRDGKPVPGAKFTTVDSRLKNEQLTGGDDGWATWKPAPGRYSVYTSAVRKTPGEFNGTKYDEVREFATLAFTWPLTRKEADPAAVALFEEAIATRASWKDFPGFSAEVSGQVDGRAFKGTVTVDGGGAVELKIDDEAARQWVTDQLESIAMHRGASSAKPGADRPKPVLRFADDDADHPLGRLLIFEGGRFASSYRIKDKQIVVVNRHLGKQLMTITVLDNERNRDGQFLPRSYAVQYWDAATGDLRRTETVHERWQRVGTWDLPTVHTVTLASDTGLAVRSVTLTKHQLLKSTSR
jgi:Protein of unknown function (DUF3386)